MDDGHKKYIKDIGTIGAASILNNLKSLILIPLLTKTLGSADYGIWTQFRITLLFLVPFVGLGAQSSIIRFLSGDRDKKAVSKDFCSFLSMSLSGGALFLLIFQVFSRDLSVLIFRSEDYTGIIRVLSFLLLFESLNLLTLNYFKAFRYINTYFSTVLSETILELCLIFYAVFKGYGIMGAALGILAVRVMFTVLRYFFVFKEIGFSLPDFSKIKSGITFGLPLVLSYTFFSILDSGDRYVINYFLGLEKVGYYSVGYSLSYMIVLVTAPICYIFYPTLAAFLNNKNYNEALRYYSYSFKYLALIGIAAGFGIFALGGSLISLFSTNEFINVRALLPLLLSGLFIFQIGVMSEYVIILSNRTALIMFLHLTLAVMNIFLNIIFVPRLGMAGAAITTFFSYSVFTIFSLLYSRKFLKYNVDFAVIIKSVFAGILMSVVILFFNPRSVPQVIFSALSGLVLYFLTLYFLKVFNQKEIIFLKKVFSMSK